MHTKVSLVMISYQKLDNMSDNINWSACPDCNGSGVHWNAVTEEDESCPSCKGTGKCD